MPLQDISHILDALRLCFGVPQPSILLKKVIFHDPATIILWSDGTKTVVKVHNEPFDKEKGLCMAVMKKALGESYHRFFKEYCNDHN